MFHSTLDRRRHRSHLPLLLVASLAVLTAGPGCIFGGGSDNSRDTGWALPDTGTDTADATPGDTEPPPGDTRREDTRQRDAADTTPVPSQTLDIPKRVRISWPGVGNTASATFTLENTGGRPLTVSDLQIEESGDSKKELAFAPSPPSQMTLLPGKSTSITLEYQPVNETPDSATVVITADDPSLTNGTAEVSVDIAVPSADIAVPSSVAFADVPKGETTHKSFTVDNRGNSALKIDDLELSGDSAFQVSFFDPDNPGDPSDDTKRRQNLWPASGIPETLDPGQSFGIRIWFSAPDPSSHNATLTIHSNDPDQPEASVELRANNGGCLALSHSKTIDFGATSTTQGGTMTVTMENCRPRGTDLRIRGLEITDDGGGVFALDQSSLPGNLAQGQTLSITGDKRVNFVVTFSPGAKKTYNGELTIRTNDPSKRNHTITLTGRGSDNACPKAVAEAKIKGTGNWSTSIQTSPSETIALTGKDSSDPDGSVQRYEWSIIERPQDSNARLKPSSSVKEPELFLDLAGDYKVELVVYDDDGSASCGSRAVVDIDARPNDDVYIELVWDTPADPDQTDSSGADVDIHYRNTSASSSTWNKDPWDCFWHNRNPDWGTKNDASDDPAMTVEDTDGAGPEVIVHDNPTSGTTYRVAAYYYDDNGYGPSYATVRVYHKGKLKTALKNKFLGSTYAFWNVVKFTGQPNTITTVDNKRKNGFP